MSGNTSNTAPSSDSTDDPVRNRQRDSAGADESHVRVEQIRKTFNDGSVVACEDVNIDIDEGEFVVLVGPSGCGKTTTLRCIAGLEQPDDGRIVVDGDDVTDAKPKDRNLAFVFQSIALFPHMTVRRNIRFGLDMNTDLPDEEKDRRVEDVAETLGIDGMLDRKPKALSGGQQQRVSLGRAMVMEPDAFLLDEPFSALDANLRDQMRVEVKQIQRELNKPMVFVTHDQEEAMTLGDKIVVMDDGNVQQIGTPHEIYNDPTNLFVADFIGSPSPNLLDCTVVEDGGELRLRNAAFEVSVTDEQAAVLRERVGDRVVLGVRPEYLALNDAETNGAFTANVDVVEPLGDRDAVHLSADGQSLSAVTPQGRVGRRTDEVAVEMEIERAWLFETDGTRLV
ncbi:sugar ABC transporter ATP-binding protein [Halobacteriales archaeon SW_6_65_15]|nr:MAG: sugar ABC transporter ATP-binding protein [Halobacteriales archaeon SW_6_65_15]